MTMLRPFLLFMLSTTLLLAVVRAEDQPVREPAADGAVSVVSPPATASQGETAIVSVATDLLSRSLEPLESGLNSDAPAGGPSATVSTPARCRW